MKTQKYLHNIMTYSTIKWKLRWVGGEAISKEVTHGLRPVRRQEGSHGRMNIPSERTVSTNVRNVSRVSEDQERL